MTLGTVAAPDPQSTPEEEQAEPDTGRRAIINGAAAAILGGGAWALVVAVTNYELGYVAWGVGGLVGYTMTRATARRGRSMALIAAGLAAMGLLVGKAFIVQRVILPQIADEVQGDSLGAARAAAWQLREAAAFPAPLQERLDALAPEDTLSDALWEEMVVAGSAHLETLGPAQRDSLAGLWASTIQSSYGFLQVLGWQFSGWDLLWFGFAISTAWRMLAAPSKASAMGDDPAPAT